MSAIPPSNANLVSGVIQTTVTQKQRAAEKAADETLRARFVVEQASSSDQQEHQVEDTLHAEDNRVRKHDEEESHQQRQHRHRTLPEDNPTGTAPDDEDKPDHIDLQA